VTSVTLGASVAELSLSVAPCFALRFALRVALRVAPRVALCVAALRIGLFPAVPLVLVIGVLALIVSSHYLRKKKYNRGQSGDLRSAPEDASE
jgi:hypothetical protein